MSDNFYGWLYSNAITMDGEKRKVYRTHSDGSPCYAKNEKDCPFIQHHQQAEKADDLRGMVAPESSMAASKSKKVETADRYKKRMANLANRVNTEDWNEDLQSELNRAVDDVLDGRSIPVRMPADTMRRDKMVDVPKWFLAAYHLACGVSDAKTSTWDDEKANQTVERFLKGIGKWTPDVYGACQRTYGKPFGEGSESSVFKAGKDKVVKSSSLGHTRSIVHAMERLMLSNLLFPGTANHIVGMGSLYGDNKNRQESHVSFILEQNKYKLQYFKNERDAQKAMAQHGFYPAYGDEYSDKAKEIRLLDCKLINIPKDSQGHIRFIDPCASLNYGKEGKLKSLSILGK